MALKDDVEVEIQEVLSTQWSTRDGVEVPEPEDIGLGNHAVKLNAAVLYADLAESTSLVENKSPAFAAEIYKSYLHCASKIIRSEGGTITAFDGDRVMAVFIGDTKRTDAVRCSLKINHAVVKLINPAIKAQYPNTDYSLKHAVGVDAGALFVARTGIRGSNDLVWVGRSANYAAKLCSLRENNYASWITASVYDNMLDSTKFSNGKTVMAIAAFDVLKERDMVDAMIVVCPKSVLGAWEKDLSVFVPGKYSVKLSEGGAERRHKTALSDFDALLTNYEGVEHMQIALSATASKKRYLLVVDESYYLKNPEALRSDSVRKLRDSCVRCFVLCGTPAPNSPYDLINQFDLADQG